MGKTFREPEVVLQCALGIEQRVRRDRLQRSLIESRPAGCCASGIEDETARVKLVLEFRDPDCALEKALSCIGGHVEPIGQEIADRLTEKLDQLAAHIGLHLAHQTVNDLHSGFDDSLARLGFPLHVVQYRVDVADDLFQFIERITLEDQHHVVA
ncbi:hypothetical protein A5675_21250 [Mycobacterium malmoense]|nr:hypothetical protein A5675_21250 [Mycobacterium malmoense]